MSNPKRKIDIPIVIWLLTGCLLVFLMVLIGGITRLTHSGLSITEWNVIKGTLPPLNEQDWILLFEKYQASPEFIKLNYHFTLSDFKGIFWWEYIHRFLGRFIGLVFIFPFLWFWFKGRINKSLMPKLLVIFFLGAFQGVLGWLMVKSGLVNQPSVSHFRLAAHLITAFLTCGYILHTALFVLFEPNLKWDFPKKAFNLKVFYLLATLIFLQIIYGAFVAGLKAGFILNTFPKMGPNWIPEGLTLFQHGPGNMVSGLIGVQFVHRMLGLMLFFVVPLWFYHLSPEISKPLKTGSKILLFLIGAQVILGIFTLLYRVPLLLGVFHQIVAFFIFCDLIFLQFFISRKS